MGGTQPLPGERINVIGTSGAGKTTLARKLASRLGCAYVELDELHHRPDWRTAELEEFRRDVDAATQGPRWVVDGNYKKTRDIVWSRADTVVWLDYRFPLVFWRVLRRSVWRSLTREALWHGNRERLWVHLFTRDSLLWWVIATHARRKRQGEELMASEGHGHLIRIRLRSPREAEAWLQSIPEAGAGPGGSHRVATSETAAIPTPTQNGS